MVSQDSQRVATIGAWFEFRKGFRFEENDMVVSDRRRRHDLPGELRPCPGPADDATLDIEHSMVFVIKDQYAWCDVVRHPRNFQATGDASQTYFLVEASERMVLIIGVSPLVDERDSSR